MIKYIDTPTYISANPTATYADLMQYCVRPIFEEIFPDATTYFLDDSNPCIGIPMYSETVASGTLYVRCSGNATTTVSTTSIYLDVYVGAQRVRPYTYTVTSGAYSGGNSAQNPRAGGWSVMYKSITDGYTLGVKTGTSADINGSTPIFVTKFKKGESYVDGIFSNYASEEAPFVVAIKDNGAVRADLVAIQHSTTNRGGLGQVFPLQMQDYKHDYLYFYSANTNPSMKGSWFNGWELLKQDAYQNNIWYKNAFTIDNQAFDAMVCSDGGSLGICKKHS